MSIVSGGGLPPLEQQSWANKSSVQELQRAIQDGTIDHYIGVPILAAKVNAAKKAMFAQAAGRPTPPSVGEQKLAEADDLMAAAEGPGPMAEPPASLQGIPGIQSNLPTEYAGGGIIAFANEGLVDSDYTSADDLEADKRLLERYRSSFTPKGIYDWATTPVGGPSKRTSTEEYRKTTQGPPSGRVGPPESPGLLQQAKDWYGRNIQPSIEGYKQQLATEDASGLDLLRGAHDWYTKALGGDDTPEVKEAAPAQDTAAPKTMTADQIAKAATISGRPSTGGAPRVGGLTATQPAIAAAQPEIAPPAAMEGSGIDALKDTQDKVDTTREDLKKLILGSDDSENKLKQRALLALMEGGFKTAAGTSPYAAANIGAGGAEGVKAFGEGIAQIEADKRSKIAQLVNLGLKGQELDMELKKLGITRDYYDMHAPLIKAQADQAEATALYHRAQANMLPALTQAKIARAMRGGSGGGGGAGGKGYIPGSVMQKELDALESFKADPTSAPFFNQMPKDVQIALTKTPAGSGSYQRAMQVFNQYANQRAQQRLNVIQSFGVKQPQLGASSVLELD